MAIYHLKGELRGTDMHEAWIIDGKIHHSFSPCISPSYAPISSHDSLREEIIELRGFIYPGLVDAHHHPGMSHTPEPATDEEILRRLKLCRTSGVTHIRDAGSQRNAGELSAPGSESSNGLPKVMYSGQHIARFKRYTRYLASEVEPDGLVAEVQRQAERSDGWIKLVGDWIDRSLPNPDLAPLWPAEVLRDAIAAAHDAGMKITVHTFASETVQPLLDAGVDGIEHGTGMSFDQILQAREQGILIDPTVYQVDRFPEFAAAGAKFPAYQKRMLTMHKHLDERLAQMIEAGSLFIMGTDTAENIGERPLSCELITAVAHGMPAALAMKAASYEGRKLLGLPTWEQGAPADFVVYDRDPELDISVTAQPKAVLIDGIYCDGAELSAEAKQLSSGSAQSDKW